MTPCVQPGLQSFQSYLPGLQKFTSVPSTTFTSSSSPQAWHLGLSPLLSILIILVLTMFLVLRSDEETQWSPLNLDVLLAHHCQLLWSLVHSLTYGCLSPQLLTLNIKLRYVFAMLSQNWLFFNGFQSQEPMVFQQAVQALNPLMLRWIPSLVHYKDCLPIG